jgi:hypothetical protein
VAATEEAARGLECTAEEGEAAVGVVGEGAGGGGLAELLDERDHELEPAEEVEALLALRAAEFLEGARGPYGGEQLVQQVLVGELPPRRLRLGRLRRLLLRRRPRPEERRQHWCERGGEGEQSLAGQEMAMDRDGDRRRGKMGLFWRAELNSRST